MADVSAPQIAWEAAGRPAPGGKTGSTFARVNPPDGICACCGGGWLAAPATPVATTGRGAEKRIGIDNPTFSSHADFLRYSDHVCAACAWFFGDPKRMHRSLLVRDGQIHWPSIGRDAADPDRPIWDDLLTRTTSGTPFTGVLTTDPKPRMWPRMQVATADAPGLYVHAPDYDTSAWCDFRWNRLDVTSPLVTRALAAGFARRAIMRGLSLGRTDLGLTLELEAMISPLRGTAELLISALIVRQSSGGST